MSHDIDILVFLSVLDEERYDLGEDCRAIFTDADLIERFSSLLDIVDISGIDSGLDEAAGDLGEYVGLVALAVELIDQGKDGTKPDIIFILAIKPRGTSYEVKYFFFRRFDELAQEFGLSPLEGCRYQGGIHLLIERFLLFPCLGLRYVQHYLFKLTRIPGRDCGGDLLFHLGFSIHFDQRSPVGSASCMSIIRYIDCPPPTRMFFKGNQGDPEKCRRYGGRYRPAVPP